MAAQAQAQKARGSREEVWSGTARATSGGLVLADLKKNARGAIVSIKQSDSAKARYPALKAKLCAATPACACKGQPCVCPQPAAAAPAAAAAVAPAAVAATALAAIESALGLLKPAETAAERSARISAEIGAAQRAARIAAEDEAAQRNRADAAQRAIEHSFVADLVALTADPIIAVAPRAAAATRLSHAARQTIHEIVADLEAIKLAHRQTENPSENLNRYSQAFGKILQRMHDFKSKTYHSHYYDINRAIYPEAEGWDDKVLKLKDLPQYHSVTLGMRI